MLKEHPAEAYELLEWFRENWCHENALGIANKIPEPLRHWLSYCQIEGLISPTPMPNITDFGHLALDHRPEAESAKPTTPEPEGKSWNEVAKRLERLRAQGESFTSQAKLAKAIGCSAFTVNKAIHSNADLQQWAKRPGAVPKAQSITPVVTDTASQSREPDPADDAAIREYLERNLTPDERAFFNSLSREGQLVFLDDPDAHGLDEQVKLRSRKP